MRVSVSESGPEGEVVLLFLMVIVQVTERFTPLVQALVTLMSGAVGDPIVMSAAQLLLLAVLTSPGVVGFWALEAFAQFLKVPPVGGSLKSTKVLPEEPPDMGAPGLSDRLAPQFSVAGSGPVGFEHGKVEVGDPR